MRLVISTSYQSDPAPEASVIGGVGGDKPTLKPRLKLAQNQQRTILITAYGQAIAELAISATEIQTGPELPVIVRPNGIPASVQHSLTPALTIGKESHQPC